MLSLVWQLLLDRLTQLAPLGLQDTDQTFSDDCYIYRAGSKIREGRRIKEWGEIREGGERGGLTHHQL
jgi:hypothetical protein